MKNIFNIKLYKEAFRQLRVIGFVFLGIFVGITLLLVMSSIALNIMSYSVLKAPQTIFASEVLGHTNLLYLIMIPVLTIKCFSFLTKRNSSDFYHSIPHTRTAVYVSFSLAVFTYVALTIALCAFLSVIPYLFMSKYITFSALAFITYAFNILVCSILVFGICTLAISLSGTIFSSILFIGIIAFLPRILVSTFTGTLIDSIFILPQFTEFGIFSDSTNMVYGQISSAKLDLSMISFSTWYTLILGIIYYVAGVFAYNRRKSEQAGNVSSNPIVQHITRTAIGFAFCLLPVCVLFQFNSSSDFTADEYYATLFSIISTFVFLSIGVMIIYELITSRRTKNLLHVLATIPVLIVLSVVFYFGLSISKNIIITNKLDVDDVNSIKFTYDEYSYDDFYPSYFSRKLTTIDIDNSEIIQFLVDKYNKQVDDYNKFMDETLPNMDTDDMYYTAEELYTSTNQKEGYVCVEFDTGVFSTYRQIFLSKSEYKEFENSISANEDVKKIYTDLPTDINSIENYYSFGSLFTSDDNEKIYEAYCKDMKDFGYEKAYKYASGMPDTVFFEGCAYVPIDGTEAELYMYVTPETTNALNMFYEILNSKQSKNVKNLEKICDAFSNFDMYNNDYSYLNIGFDIYNKETCENLGTYYADSYSIINVKNNNFIEKMSGLIKENKNNTDGKYFIIFNFDSTLAQNYSDVNYDYFGSYVYFDMSDSEIQEFLDLCKPFY